MTAFAPASLEVRFSEPFHPLPFRPIPDPRPGAVRWHRPPAAQSGMSPLPLDTDDAADQPAGRATGTPPEFEALRAHARSLLVALVDAIQGRRQTAQLTRWVSDEVMADLVLRARLHQRAPLPLAVRSFRVQLIDPAIVEASGRLQAGNRFTAVALRLERKGHRWLCAVVDFGPLAHPGDHPLPRVRGAGDCTPSLRALQERCQRGL